MKSYLEKHILSHSVVKGTKCYLCTFEPAHIRTHWKHVHSATNIDMECQYCNYKEEHFSQSENKFKHPNAQLADLETHIKEQHKGESKLHFCPKCKFSTYHEPSLNVHLKALHDFKCRLCNYEGVSSKLLKGHITKVHGHQNLPIVNVS